MKQKIVRVRVGDPINQLDEYTETWSVNRVVGQETDYFGQQWLLVLLDRDEAASAEKRAAHEAYLGVIDRLAVSNTESKPEESS